MPEKTVEISEKRLQSLEAGLASFASLSERLTEQMAWNEMLAGEDIGWTRVFGGGLDEDGGPTLEDLQEWSRKLREALGNVHIGRGLKLRRNNIWTGGIQYEGLPGGSGAGSQVKKWVEDPINVRNFFGPQAREERESALFTDSIYLVLGDPKTHILEPIDLQSIGAVQVNPRRSDEIIAYRVDYTDYTRDGGKGQLVQEWHYTDLAIGRFKIKVEKGETPPDNRVIFDQTVNTQIGWRFGVPDSLTAYAVAKIYSDFMKNGKIVSDAFAQILYTVSTGSKKETDNVAAKLSELEEAGSTLIGNSALNPVSTAGKSYDFDAGRPLAAQIAAALEVSVISLTADPGTAGSSYGSAQTLDLPTKLAVLARRELHIEFDRRVLIWMGAKPDKLQVKFGTLSDSTEAYRQLQALVLALSTGMFKPEPIQNAIADLLGFIGGTIPADWLEMRQKLASGGAASTPAPDQGKSNPAGGSDNNGNDVRGDTQT